MPDEVILKSAKIVTESEVFEGSVQICGGLIADVHRGPSAVPAAFDLEGDYLIPGLIDIHTDNLERHIMPRQSTEWPVMAALIAHDAQLATAGITTVLDSLCVGTIGNGVRSFEKVKEAISLSTIAKRNRMFRTEHLLHLRAEISNEQTPRMFAQLYEHPDVALVSLMDHTPGQRQWTDLERYIAVEKRDYKLSDEEVRESLRRFQENQQKYAQSNRRELLAMVSGQPIVLASHDDTTVEHVEEAHADGIAISEFPTTMLAARAAREREMHIVAGSPNLVLGRSHSGNVRAADLARSGLVDVLSSDYVPSSLLHGAFLLSMDLGLALSESLKMVTLNPARLVGLHDRGTIAQGKRADLVRVRQVENIPLPLMIWRQGERVG